MLLHVVDAQDKLVAVLTDEAILLKLLGRGLHWCKYTLVLADRRHLTRLRARCVRILSVLCNTANATPGCKCYNCICMVVRMDCCVVRLAVELIIETFKL